MELEQLKDMMKIILKPSRYLHSIGVEEVSCDLACIYGYDTEKASIAGILHDCAKCLTDEQLVEECHRFQLPVKEVELGNKQLLHAKVGAVYVKHHYGIVDEDIINAIYYHTTGRPAMSLLEKIIYIADYIEPYRKPLQGMEKIRSTAYEDIDLAVFMIAESVLNYLQHTGALIDTLTVETYEYYETVIKNREMKEVCYGQF
ncbi:MAG: hypothetical protein K0S76_2143 [Herbinix sp.]|jgi:predicted HD superfamily hydrolase involved in NAD metabolism|nr:hypothetical protein [Herbinix sp.]